MGTGTALAPPPLHIRDGGKGGAQGAHAPPVFKEKDSKKIL